MEWTSQQVLTFCRAHGKPCMALWPDDRALEWLEWHDHVGSLVVSGGPVDITGFSICWQWYEDRIEVPWIKTDPDGDAIYVAHWAALSPEANREMVAEWKRRLPAWDRLPVRMRRAGRGLVTLKPRHIGRFCRPTTAITL